MDYTLITGAKSTTGSLKNWVNYDLLPVDELLIDAQNFIYSRLRVREMRATAAIAVSIGNATAALPARFLDPIFLLDTKLSAPIAMTHEADLLQTISRDANGATLNGVPARYAIYNEAINFDCGWDSARTLTMLFYQRPALLSGANLTNFLTDRYPRLLRCALLAFAADYRQDDANYARWIQQVAEMIAAANAEADLSRRSTDIAG